MPSTRKKEVSNHLLDVSVGYEPGVNIHKFCEESWVFPAKLQPQVPGWQVGGNRMVSWFRFIWGCHAMIYLA